MKLDKNKLIGLFSIIILLGGLIYYFVDSIFYFHTRGYYYVETPKYRSCQVDNDCLRYTISGECTNRSFKGYDWKGILNEDGLKQLFREDENCICKDYFVTNLCSIK